MLSTVGEMRKITTFEERVEAAKIITRAIEHGLLDDAGEVAEITPEEFSIDGDGHIIGVVVTIRSDCNAESNVRLLREPPRSRERRASDLVESRLLVPAR